MTALQVAEALWPPVLVWAAVLTPLAVLAWKQVAVPVRNQVAALVLAWGRPAVLLSWIGW